MEIMREFLCRSDMQEFISLTESDKSTIASNLINKLYESVINKRYIDFDKIPLSKGDITKYVGYTNMMDSLSIIKKLSSDNKKITSELMIIETAVNNIITYKDIFIKGFRLDKSLPILLYNTLVLACVEATSLMISSYVEFIRQPNSIEFKLSNSNNMTGNLCLKNLSKFNDSVKKGDFSKSMKYVIGNDSTILSESAGAIATLVIVGLLLIVPILRELVFYFYYSRLKISEFLQQQVYLIETERISVEANSVFTEDKKAKILAKQDKYIKIFNRINDKIKINDLTTSKEAKKEMKEESKGWSMTDYQMI